MRAKQILIVDDDSHFTQAVIAAMAMGGLNANRALNLSEARLLIAGRDYDLVLLDAMLPDGKGLELIPELKARKSNVRILLLSAYLARLEDNPENRNKLGVARILHKPIQPMDLLETVRATLEPGSAQSQEEPGRLNQRARFDRHMQKLRAAYEANLPNRLWEIKAAVNALRSAPGDEVARNIALRRVHNLHGTSGTYGLNELSRASLTLEEVLRKQKGKEFAAVDRALDNLMRIQQQGLTPTPGGPAHEPKPHFDHSLLMFSVDAKQRREAALLGRSQNIEVIPAGDAAEVTQVLSGAGIDVALVAIDNTHVDQTVNLIARLAKHDPPIPIAAMVGVTLLDQRLKAVQAGASLLLEPPLAESDLSLLQHLGRASHIYRRPKVLLLEPDAALRRKLMTLFASNNIETFESAGPAQLLEELAREHVDLAVMGAQLPESDGFALCRLLRATPIWSDLAVLLTTTSPDPHLQVRAQQAESNGLLRPPLQDDDLLARVRGLTRRARLREEMRDRDPLTGLPTQAGFRALGQAHIEEAKRSGRVFTLLRIRIADFDLVNRRHGYAFGNSVLAGISSQLQSSLRLYDARARSGIDEFAVLVHDQPQPIIEAIKQRLVKHVGDMTFSDSRGVPSKVRLEIGSTRYPAKGSDPDFDELMRRAAPEFVDPSKGPPEQGGISL